MNRTLLSWRNQNDKHHPDQKLVEKNNPSWALVSQVTSPLSGGFTTTSLETTVWIGGIIPKFRSGLMSSQYLWRDLKPKNDGAAQWPKDTKRIGWILATCLWMMFLCCTVQWWNDIAEEGTCFKRYWRLFFELPFRQWSPSQILQRGLCEGLILRASQGQAV